MERVTEKRPPVYEFHVNTLNVYILVAFVFTFAGKDNLEFGRLSWMSKEEKCDLLKSYQETIDNLRPILTFQDNLRALCSLKMTFGYVETPAIYEPDDDDFDDSDDDISYDDGDFEESHTPSCEIVIERTDIDKVVTSSNCEPPQPFEFSLTEYERESKGNAADNTFPKTTDSTEILKMLENLELQFAELKAENETLKESIEQILESKSVF
uniref:Uncharacterized protein n=1 Tax=Panagrolaimus sp. ES5 TaxID=591445 RepID=A0AC34FWS5_9BILA